MLTILDYFISFIRFLCWLLSIIIITRAVLSWFWPRPTNALMIYLYKVTEPLLRPLRRIIPRTGMIDFSPVLALLILFLISVILGSLQ